MLYSHKIAHVYGYHGDALFVKVPHLKKASASWRRAADVVSTPAGRPLSYLEKLAVDYWKKRLEVGMTFALPSSMVPSNVGAPDAVEELSLTTFQESFMAPCPRSQRVECGDVVFTVVDSHPEAKKLFTGSRLERVAWHVVVREHAPCIEAGGRLPQEWSLAWWDVRQWCSSHHVFHDVACSLLRCTGVAEGAVISARHLRCLPGFAAAPPSPQPLVHRCVSMPARTRVVL